MENAIANDRNLLFNLNDDDSIAGDLNQNLEELRFEDDDDEGTIFKVR